MNVADLFSTLAKLLSSFPSLLGHSRFLLIPGPTDPWSSLLLPRPALPASMVKALKDKVPNITFGSNPCRIRYFSQEIVVFREDMMGRLMRNKVRMGNNEGGDLRKAVSVPHLDFLLLSSKFDDIDGVKLTLSLLIACSNDFGSSSFSAVAH